MDRRQQKTRNAIFQAFNHLLEEKQYSSITVQDILDEADIGRSTFYSHFETKDALLREMCTGIFDHIFSHELHSETSHDFSSSVFRMILLRIQSRSVSRRIRQIFGMIDR